MSTNPESPSRTTARAFKPGPGFVVLVVATGAVIVMALAAAVLASGRSGLACEVNLDPPNPGSLAFHARLGFRPVGEARDPRNGKRVLYLCREAGPGMALSPPSGVPPWPGPAASRRNPGG